MPLIDTSQLTPLGLSPSENLQTYCGLDCCVTLEVWEELQRTFNQPPEIYNFERALQGPYLEIMQRGFAVDAQARAAAAGVLRERIQGLQGTLNQLAMAVWDKPLNPRSPKQIQDFFYGRMRLPQVWILQKGERKLSTNREALEKLEVYLYARPIIAAILAIRDLAKQLEVFETEIDSDGRFRTSYNIAGTETGRSSSSSNAFGTGGNLQNISPPLRYVFVADPGRKLCQIDLEQVEMRDEGFFIGCLFDDWKFLDACETGDAHTVNSRLVWPELGWTGDIKRDREIAERPFYRQFSYRDMAKRGGHLCLTEDHEVLTPEGWVSIAKKPRIIMTWSEEKSEFAEVIKWTDELYTGNLHHFLGNSMSLVMTENHRVPYKTDQRNFGKIKVRRAKEGPGAHMPLGHGWIGGCDDVPARLIAAFMSDGHQKSKNRMEFHLKKTRKIERLKYLCDLYGFTCVPVPERDKYMVHGRLPKRAGAFQLNWKRDCLVDFIDEYKYWDGHIGNTSVTLFSVDKQHLEWIQTFGRILGIGGQIRKTSTTANFGNSDISYTTDYYSLGQNNRKWAAGRSIEWNKYSVEKRRVLCPTVPSEFFYVRRGGKICVTGNTDYMGTAWTMARALKIPQAVAEDFQARFCRGDPQRGIEPAYPGIPRYWQWVAQELQTTHQLTTPFGRRRQFFGRPSDDTTLREAIAFLPQSTTADRTNLVLWRIWKHLPEVQLLGQTYDSVCFQYPEGREDLVEAALTEFQVPLWSSSGRKYVVPAEAKTGWNWGYEVTERDRAKARAAGKPVPQLNLDGLAKWPERQQRQRQRKLERVFS